MTRVLLSCIIIFAVSCSIIGDDAITDPNGFPRISTLEFNGETQDGPSFLASARFEYDNQNRIKSLNWSGLKTQGEFRFRSGSLLPLESLQGTAFLAEPSAVNVVTEFSEYDASGRVTRIINSSNIQIFEAYTFVYDNQSRVISFTTQYGDISSSCLTNGADCGGSAVALKDTIVYSGSKISYIKRQVLSGDPKSQLAIYIGYGQQPASFNFGGTADDVGAIAIKQFANREGIPTAESNIFGTDQFTTSNNYAYFQNDLGNWYGGLQDFNNSNGIFPFIGNIDIRTIIRGNVFALMTIKDIRLYSDGSFQNDQLGRSDYRNRLPDYYYFHPFTIFPTLFKYGQTLAQLYFTDWWIVNQETSSTFQFTQDRSYQLYFSFTK